MDTEMSDETDGHRSNARLHGGMQPRDPKKNVVFFLKELIQTGRYRAVIDRSFPLEYVVDATRYVETEQKTGNVLLTLSRA